MQINSNTVAVVTGAASGIGRAFAQHLGAKGAALALADVNEAGLEETRASLSGVKTSLHIVNVADASRVDTFAQEVLEQHGRANLLFNNAGVALGGRFSEVTLEDMHWLFTVISGFLENAFFLKKSPSNTSGNQQRRGKN